MKIEKDVTVQKQISLSKLISNDDSNNLVKRVDITIEDDSEYLDIRSCSDRIDGYYTPEGLKDLIEFLKLGIEKHEKLKNETPTS